MIIASVLLFYKGALTRRDIREMPPRELYGYIRAANILSGEEPEKEGLHGEDAINALMNDPAIKVKDGDTR